MSDYGPDAIATPANMVTVVRLLVAPLLFAMIGQRPSGWVVFILWVVLSLTDGIDGWIARRQGTTRSGAFLDPLADKVLVLGAMFALVGAGRFLVWPVVIIAAREVAISLYRLWWGRRGLAIPARRSAKWKTFVQTVAVGAVLCPLTTDAVWLGEWLLYAATALAVFSAVQYVIDGGRAMTAMDRAAGPAGPAPTTEHP